MKEKVKLGVIGCGRIAQAHFAAIDYLKERAELVAVADVEEGKAREAAQRFGARTWSHQYEEVLNHPEVEAVIPQYPSGR